MVTNSGVEYDSATACASGRCTIAQKPASMPTRCRCSSAGSTAAACSVRSRPGPWRSSSGSVKTKPNKLRKKAISKACSCCGGQADAHRHQAEQHRAGDHQQPPRAARRRGARRQRCSRAASQRAPMMRGSGSSATPKRLLHRGGDAARQRQQLRTGGVAVVDQHQRMLRGDAGVAFAKALPAGLFDQPGGGKLAHRRVVAGNTGRPGCSAAKASATARGQHRILEKAAGIADQRRVRQLARAQAADRLGHVRGARRLDAHRRQFLAHAGVVQAQLALPRQAELDRGDRPVDPGWP